MKMLFLTKTQDTVTNHIETVPTPKQSDSKMQTSSHNSIIATPDTFVRIEHDTSGNEQS